MNGERSLKAHEWASDTWASNTQNSAYSRDQSITCLSMVQYREKAHLDPTYQTKISDHHNTSGLARNSLSSAENVSSVQSSTLLSLHYSNVTSDNEIACKDIFYAISELFSFCAVSENQFINHLQNRVDDALRYVNAKEDLSLETLHHCSVILDNHISRIEETLKMIKHYSRESNGWSSAPVSKPLTIVQEKYQTLILEYSAILRRSKEMAERCARNAKYITNSAALKEARDFRRQTRRLEWLTTLAFVFVPVAFISSFFGMNFKSRRA